MSKRNWSDLRVPWGTVAALLLVSGVGIYELRRTSTASAATPPASASPGKTSRIFAEGRLVTAPGAEVTVATEMAGRLVRLGATERSRVARGDVLAELAATEERAALGEARARIGEAKVDLAIAEKELARTTRLQKDGVVTPAELDRATHAADAARARIRSLGATVARLEASLEKAKIVAPLSGVVVTQHVDSGEVVSPGAPLFTIVDLSRMRIEAEIGEFDIARVKPDATVKIVAEGFEGQSWEGRVVEIPDWVTSRRLKPLDPGRPADTRILPVQVSLPAAHPFKLGQRVEIELVDR